MTEEKDIVELLEDFSDKIGYSVEKAYKIYKEAQTAIAVSQGVGSLIAFFGWIYAVKTVLVISREPIIAVMAAFIFGIAAIIVAIMIEDTMLRLVAPEYKAIKDLVGEVD